MDAQSNEFIRQLQAYIETGISQSGPDTKLIARMGFTAKWMSSVRQLYDLSKKSLKTAIDQQIQVQADLFFTLFNKDEQQYLPSDDLSEVIKIFEKNYQITIEETDFTTIRYQLLNKINGKNSELIKEQFDSIIQETFNNLSIVDSQIEEKTIEFITWVSLLIGVQYQIEFNKENALENYNMDEEMIIINRGQQPHQAVDRKQYQDMKILPQIKAGLIKSELYNELIECYEKGFTGFYEGEFPSLQNVYNSFRIVFDPQLKIIENEDEFQTIDINIRQQVMLIQSQMVQNGLIIKEGAVATSISAINVYLKKLNAQVAQNEQSFGGFFKQLNGAMEEAMKVRQELNHRIKMAINFLVSQQDDEEEKKAIYNFYSDVITNICLQEIDEYSYKIIDVEVVKQILEKTFQNETFKKFFGTTLAESENSLSNNYDSQLHLFGCIMQWFAPILSYKKTKSVPLNFSKGAMVNEKCLEAKNQRTEKNLERRYAGQPDKLKAIKEAGDNKRQIMLQKRTLQKLQQKQGEFNKRIQKSQPKFIAHFQIIQDSRDQLNEAM